MGDPAVAGSKVGETSAAQYPLGESAQKATLEWQSMFHAVAEILGFEWLCVCIRLDAECAAFFGRLAVVGARRIFVLASFCQSSSSSLERLYYIFS